MFLPLSFSSDLQLQREEGEGERQRQKEKYFPIEMRRVAVDSSVGVRLSLLTSKHSAMQNSQKPPKPVIRLHFEHQGNSFTSRSDYFKLCKNLKISSKESVKGCYIYFGKSLQ